LASDAQLSIPSTLKLWIDQVRRVGKTFSYGLGREGMLSGKESNVDHGHGGVYEHGTALAAMTSNPLSCAQCSDLWA